MVYADLDTIHNPSAGLVAPSSWGDQVRDNLEFLVDPPQVSVDDASTQTISTSTFTVLAADQENYDTDAMHSTSTNNSRLTCVTAGKYTVWSTVQKADSNSTNRCVSRFLVNGTTAYIGATLASASFWSASVVRTITLAVDDYVECEVWQDSGGNRIFQLVEFGARFAAR